MQKKMFLVLLAFISIVAFTPVKTNALDINRFNLTDNIYLLDNGTGGLMDDYNKDQTCDGDNSILGSVNDEDSVAWLLQQILNYIKVLGPILVIVLSSIDFVQVIIKSDDDAMKKATKKLGYRLILSACLFFIPVLVGTMLNIFGITSNVTCGLE